MREMRGQLDAIEGGEAQLDALELAAKESREAYLKARRKGAEPAD